MKQFKIQFKAAKYTATEFVNDRIYVCKDEHNNYHRVRIFGALRGIRVYQIDTGTYDIVNKESIYYITREFIKLSPLAFKASLASKKINIYIIVIEILLLF